MKLFLKFHCKQSHTSLVVFFQSQCLAYQVQIQTLRLRTPHPPDCRAPCSCSNKKRRWAAVTVKGRQVGLRREREAEPWMTPPGSIPRFSSEMQRDCWCQSTDVLYIIKRCLDFCCYLMLFMLRKNNVHIIPGSKDSNLHEDSLLTFVICGSNLLIDIRIFKYQ